MNEQSYKGKVAIISGSMGYIGFEVAQHLAREGFSVAMFYHRTPEDIVAKKLAELEGTSHFAYQCDLSDAKIVHETFALVSKNQGDIYACIHTAGQKPDRKKLTASSPEDLEVQFKGNVLTSFNFLTESARCLKESKDGIIIGITTIGVELSEATRSLGAYIPAKYAVQGILATLREEMIPCGVRVHAILPGFMPGGMNADIPKAFVQMIQEKSKTHTLAQASLIAEIISDLCKNEEGGSERFSIPVAPEYGLL